MVHTIQPEAHNSHKLLHDNTETGARDNRTAGARAVPETDTCDNRTIQVTTETDTRDSPTETDARVARPAGEDAVPGGAVTSLISCGMATMRLMHVTTAR